MLKGLEKGIIDGKADVSDGSCGEEESYRRGCGGSMMRCGGGMSDARCDVVCVERREGRSSVSRAAATWRSRSGAAAMFRAHFQTV